MCPPQLPKSLVDSFLVALYQCTKRRIVCYAYFNLQNGRTLRNPMRVVKTPSALLHAWQFDAKCWK